MICTAKLSASFMGYPIGSEIIFIDGSDQFSNPDKADLLSGFVLAIAPEDENWGGAFHTSFRPKYVDKQPCKLKSEDVFWTLLKLVLREDTLKLSRTAMNDLFL